MATTPQAYDQVQESCGKRRFRWGPVPNLFQPINSLLRSNKVPVTAISGPVLRKNRELLK